MARPPVRAFRPVEKALRLAAEEMDVDLLRYRWSVDGVSCGTCGAVQGCACFSKYESMPLPDPYLELPEMLDDVRPDRVDEFYAENGWFPRLHENSDPSCIEPDDAAKTSAETEEKHAS